MREFFEYYLTHGQSINKTSLISNTAVLIAIGIIFGFLGIMKFDQVAVIQAIGYWVTISIAGFFIYTPILYWGNKINMLAKVRWLWRLLILSVVASILMCFVIVFVSALFFGWSELRLSDFPQLFFNSLLIGSVIHSLIITKHYLQYQTNRVKQIDEISQNQDTAATEHKFIERLPLRLRGQLLCVKSEDHYLQVFTDKGQHMLLMRLKDAINELQTYPGLQTHRSWWVAEHAVTDSISQDGKTFLKLKNNIQAPVSRTYLPLIKQKKLL